MLTAPGDVVLDIFAGSNTTGQVAEAEGRRWLAFELSKEFAAASAFRFVDRSATDDDIRTIYARILAGGPITCPTISLSRCGEPQLGNGTRHAHQLQRAAGACLRLACQLFSWQLYYPSCREGEWQKSRSGRSSRTSAASYS